MLEQREQLDRRQVLRARPRRRAARTRRLRCRAGRRRRNRPPRCSSVRARRRPGAPARGPRVTSAAVFFSCTASRSATAIASASSSALRGLDHGYVRERGVARRGCRSARPSARSRPTAASPRRRRGRAPSRRRAGPPRRARCRCAAAAHASRAADGRTAGSDRRPRVPPIRLQEASSRSVSSPGSTTAPCRSVAMVGEQLGGCRHRAGRAGGDHRPGMRREPRALGLDQQIAPRRRLDRAALLQDRRPGLARDLAGSRA